MYLYGDTDPLYRRNFEFFAEHGMDAGGGSVNYIVFVQVVSAALGALRPRAGVPNASGQLVSNTVHSISPQPSSICSTARRRQLAEVRMMLLL